MKVLFIGGTGLISGECAALALDRGIDLSLLTRGHRPPDFPAATRPPHFITADITNEAATAAALGRETFDCVVNFIAYKSADIERDIRLFAGRTQQYVLISSASCYQKPPADYRVTEETPLANPFWQYARDKIACETALMAGHHQRQFPATIVRPSLTYGRSRIPASYHNSTHCWTTAHRLLAGKPIIVHGDGAGLWQVTHAADVAQGLLGLLGNPTAIGQAFHITTDEVLTWDRILLTLAQTLGVTAKIVHVPADVLAHFDPARGPGILGDKQHSVIIDNIKIKHFVPGFQATITLAEGLQQTVAWFRADPRRQTLDEKIDTLTDRIIAAMPPCL